ncbi:hypothetical protein DL95DRAFT_416365 [Leptodontidium sp. 2 PMI_412]|nr:hypothetical protein DL95DRAFT_416365 [Leptodontidium sp. 2 PMI_412]
MSNLDLFFSELPDRYLMLFPQALHAFPQFLELLLEPRLLIWRLAIPRQRKVWLHPKRHRHKRKIFHMPILPVIQVCHESRGEIHHLLDVDINTPFPKPLYITKFDIVRWHFNLAFRQDRPHNDLFWLLLNKNALVRTLREIEMVVDDFGALDEALLFISWDDIFPQLRELEILRLVVPKGARWIEECRSKLFREAARGVES